MSDLTERAKAILSYGHVGLDTLGVIRDQIAEIGRLSEVEAAAKALLADARQRQGLDGPGRSYPFMDPLLRALDDAVKS